MTEVSVLDDDYDFVEKEIKSLCSALGLRQLHIKWGPGSLLPAVNLRGMKLVRHLHVVPKLLMSGTIPALLLYRQARMDTHTLTLTHSDTHTHTHSHTHSHSRAHAYTHTHIHTHTHTCARAHTFTLIHIHAQSLTHTITLTHTTQNNKQQTVRSITFSPPKLNI